MAFLRPTYNGTALLTPQSSQGGHVRKPFVGIFPMSSPTTTTNLRLQVFIKSGLQEDHINVPR